MVLSQVLFIYYWGLGTTNPLFLWNKMKSDHEEQDVYERRIGLIGSINWHIEYNISPEAGDYSHVFWDYSNEDYWKIVSIKKPHFQGKVIRKGK